MQRTIIKHAALNALGTTAYVIAVATFLSNAQTLFGSEEPKTVLVPIAMLLLLVISAAITGSLVVGRPILWYLDGRKQDAVQLLIATIASLFAVILLAFTGLALM